MIDFATSLRVAHLVPQQVSGDDSFPTVVSELMMFNHQSSSSRVESFDFKLALWLVKAPWRGRSKKQGSQIVKWIDDCWIRIFVGVEQDDVPTEPDLILRCFVACQWREWADSLCELKRSLRVVANMVGWRLWRSSWAVRAHEELGGAVAHDDGWDKNVISRLSNWFQAKGEIVRILSLHPTSHPDTMQDSLYS